jgi:hypothetical protein
LLLTVLHTPDGLEKKAEISAMWRSYVAECRMLLGERLNSQKASIDSAGVRVQALVREGIPAEEIVRVAQQEEVELIAMGSRGAFAASRAFLGSVSKRVMQTAHCPILTVPSTWIRNEERRPSSDDSFDEDGLEGRGFARDWDGSDGDGDYAERRRVKRRRQGKHGSDRKRRTGTRRVIE